jgi:hypothetical protein
LCGSYYGTCRCPQYGNGSDDEEYNQDMQLLDSDEEELEFD